MHGRRICPHLSHPIDRKAIRLKKRMQPQRQREGGGVKTQLAAVARHEELKVDGGQLQVEKLGDLLGHDV